MYERKEKIATGRHKVYLGTNKETKKTVALKKIASVFGWKSLGEMEEANREIRTMRALTHINVLALLDTITNRDLDPQKKKNKTDLYLVLEYHPRTLAGLPSTPQKPEARRILREICAGLDYLHAQGIVHRDIKPSNIFISGKGAVKIADFGSSNEVSPTMTRHVGTLNYMAIEILLGSRTYSAPVDLWSAGCVFHELLTGTKIFPAMSQIEQITKIAGVLGVTRTQKDFLSQHPYGSLLPLTSPRNKFGDLEEEDKQILRRLLDYDPEKRSASMNIRSFS